MNKLHAGTVETLLVEREAPFGYFLTDGETEVLLHKNEIVTPLNVQQSIPVFLYQDHQGRLAATMTIPNIAIGTYGWVKVVEVKPQFGVFVSIGISKDVLVSKDDLPVIEEIWPTVGDDLYCTLKTDKNGRLFGAAATEEVIQDIAVEADESVFNKNIYGTVYRTLKVGTFIITDEGYRGFIHESERKKEPRLGQKVEGRIIGVKEDRTVNISLIPRKQESMGPDADKIYEFIDSLGGAMPYWDKSDPEDINERFQMSKGAFKRAIGKLMKENKVYQEDGWTYFKK